MKNELEKIKIEAIEAINTASEEATLRELEVKYLGRKGLLTNLLKGLKDLSIDEKKVIGPLSNAIKTELQGLINKKRIDIEDQILQKQLSEDFLDISFPVENKKGAIHPLNIALKEVCDIFSKMGFEIGEGPEIDSEYYNFDSVNIPNTHPARDMQDTFFLKDEHSTDKGKTLPRTHTSNAQVRYMEEYGAPLKMIIPGRVFRNEALDATHSHTFHQVEGMMIGEDISLAHLKGVLKEFLSKVFKSDLNIRFRPGYFPFVEPGLEVDFSCLLCKGKGCRVCSNTGWVEFMGAGMIHPNVLKAGKIDSKKYQGFAFGFGLDRLVMMKHKITDIRHFYQADIKFLKQF